MASDGSATSIGRVKNSLIQYENPKKTVRGLSLLFLGKAALKKEKEKNLLEKISFLC